MIQIRKAFPTDAYSLIQITDIAWKEAFYDLLPNGILSNMCQEKEKRVTHLRDQIQENNRVLVACEDGMIVGFIFFAKASNEMYIKSAEIRSICVLPEFQKKGIGSRLLEEAKKEIEKLGFNTLVLYCPICSTHIDFFYKMGARNNKVHSKKIMGYEVPCYLLLFDLTSTNSEIVLEVENSWNDLFLKAQEHLHLLNDVHREIAVISSSNGNIYYGLGIRSRVCPIEAALSNMYLGQDTEVDKILILDRKSKPVFPCGKCRDLLISLKQGQAEILFDFGTLKTMTLKDLNPYYKDIEKV